MKNFFTIIFLAITLLFSTTAFSVDYYVDTPNTRQQLQSPTGLNLGISFNVGGPMDKTYTDYIYPGPGLGLNLGFKSFPYFSVYLELLTNFVFVYNQAKNVDIYFINTNLGFNIYVFPASRFQPFVSLGFGNFHMEVNAKDLYGYRRSYKSDNQQTFFIGIGSEFIINKNMTIPFKFQYTQTFRSGNDLNRISLWNLLIGFNYYFF